MRLPAQRDAGCGSLAGEREEVSALEAAVAPPVPMLARSWREAAAAAGGPGRDARGAGEAALDPRRGRNEMSVLLPAL